MCAWIVPPVAGLIEPVPAPEFYVENIGGIEMMSGCIRLHLYAEQMALEAGGNVPSKIVVLKIVGPLGSVPYAIAQLAQCLWRRPAVEAEPPAPSRGPYLVR